MTQTIAMVGLTIQGGGASQATANQQRANARDMQNAARELGDAIRANVDQHVIQARAEAAAQAALAQNGGLQPVPPVPPTGPGSFRIQRPDGQPIVTFPKALTTLSRLRQSTSRLRFSLLSP